MNEAIQNLVNRMIEDYNQWTYRVAKGELSENNKRMMKDYAEKVEVKAGRKYIKIIQNRSVWGFIVATEDDKQFNYGDILMAAGYNQPARNKARGNVFDLENLRVQWTGANYL
jgi:heme-binding NEAT domain protein